ncbi:spore protease YyaC [Lutispora thermophila]|uniref:Putative sporulation protein YyaC n=1 Tax=Lutispora thermophila DSM 19022 TaxID=1122184 RepID=A0A1M6ANQ0_9FIRM|nr:spore protease YyaC [Lutispora thermophila]SHI38139.1 putative sporulation protein YyaC [Lutispora thermophila DSM 19022]
MEDSPKTFYFQKDSHIILADYLSRNIKGKCLVFCIGTDRYIGDCLGPLTGTFLSKMELKIPILGTLENPIHAVNLTKHMYEVRRDYPNHKIIAVDACLGNEDNIGSIQIKKGPIHPGKGVGKRLPPVGDISIVGIVDSSEAGEFLSMHNIRLNLVMKMAEVITRGIYIAFK